jgi:Uma2 family endonuclease
MTEVENLNEWFLVVHTSPVLNLDDEQLFRFCQLNRELNIERTSDGDLIFMAPESGGRGSGNSELNFQFAR